MVPFGVAQKEWTMIRLELTRTVVEPVTLTPGATYAVTYRQPGPKRTSVHTLTGVVLAEYEGELIVKNAKLRAIPESAITAIKSV